MMDPDDPATSAFASGTVPDDNGVPTYGEIEINMALDENGVTKWYLDPTPDDHSEFMGDLVHAFAREETPGGPADDKRDLRTLLIHEIGHVMGVSAGSQLMYDNPDVTVEDTDITDPNGGSPDNDYWVFRGPSVNVLMTDYDIGGDNVASAAGHLAMPRDGNEPVEYDGLTLYSAVEIMQPTSLSVRRVLLSNKVALMMQDMGYDVIMPELYGTFHAVLDPSTGLLTVRGGNDNTEINFADQGASDDVISISSNGAWLMVSVDVGVDVPGTGAGMSDLDQQDAFVSFFPVADVTGIRVEGLGGNDSITFSGLFGFINGDDLTVFGGDGNDTISGGGMTDAQMMVIDGEDGNDSIVGGPGHDELLGGTGNDTVRGNAGDDYILGDLGADHLQGNTGADTVYGNSGNDYIIGGSIHWDPLIPIADGADVLGGYDGNDTIHGDNVWANVSWSIGGGGNDTIRGGADEDTLFGGLGNDSIDGEAGRDYVSGLWGNDDLEGGDGDDEVVGYDGNDTVRGNAGDDSLTGGEGNDELYAGIDDDTARGGNGEDLILGDLGDDWLEGGSGRDTVYGNAGDDYVVGGTVLTHPEAIVSDQADVLGGHEGDDFVHGDNVWSGAPVTTGGGGDDLIHGGEENDTLLGGVGNDTIYGDSGDDLASGLWGNDSVDGGDGADTVLGYDGTDTLIGGLGVDSLDGGAGEDTVVGGTWFATELDASADILRGGEADDLLIGDNTGFGPATVGGNDTVYGDGGNDALYGQLGDDSMSGGTGDDTLIAFDGRDVLSGEDGADDLRGGSGADVVYGGLGDDSLQGEGDRDTLYGETDDDTLLGGDGDDYLSGGSGHDSVEGGAGVDRIFGDDGSDFLSGGDGDDLVRGGAGSDLLRGNAGNDVLLGEAGQDEVLGHDGRDVLIGGLDPDRLGGGFGDDLLIAGTTVHDGSDKALSLIRDEWTSPRAYADRVNNLRGVKNPTFDARLNGDVFLRKGVHVFDDGGGNVLSGEADPDWFFFAFAVDVTDRVAGEAAN